MEALEEVDEFVDDLRLARADITDETAVDVRVQNIRGEAPDRLVRRRELDEDVVAVAVLLHHAPDALKLPRDAVEPRGDRLLFFLAAHRRARFPAAAVCHIRSFLYRNIPPMGMSIIYPSPVFVKRLESKNFGFITNALGKEHSHQHL